jgi:hypothetical protein
MMTITPHGYPDFGRYVAQSDVLHILEVDKVFSATFQYPYTFVGYTPYIWISLRSFANGIRMLLEYFTDAVSGINTGFQDFHIGHLGFVAQAVPVLGPYVRVTTFPALANSEYSLVLSQAAAQASTMNSDVTQPVLVEKTNIAIAAGASADTLTTFSWAGEAVWTVEMAGHGLEASLATVDYLGAVRTIAYRFRAVGVTTPMEPVKVFLPGMQIRLRVKNLTAAGDNYFAYLVARPLGVGA